VHADEQEAVVGLRRIYEAAEADLRGHPELFCKLSGRCCRFEEAGHELFLTALEYREMAARGGVPAREAAAACPWLEDGLCANREGRALACRTYFCSDEAAAARVTERWHLEIRRLHDELGLPYVYRSLQKHVNT